MGGADFFDLFAIQRTQRNTLDGRSGGASFFEKDIPAFTFEVYREAAEDLRV